MPLITDKKVSPNKMDITHNMGAMGFARMILAASPLRNIDPIKTDPK
jgi:hypothetical protein